MRVIMRVGAYNFLLKPDINIQQAVNIIDGVVEVEKEYRGQWAGVATSKTDLQLIVLPGSAIKAEERGVDPEAEQEEI